MPNVTHKAILYLRAKHHINSLIGGNVERARRRPVRTYHESVNSALKFRLRAHAASNTCEANI